MTQETKIIANGTAVILKETIKAVVAGYDKGWYTLALEDGGSAKARAKDLEIVIQDEPKAQGPIKITCTECAHQWEEDTPKVNVRCPECKAWNIVRLKPNRENYVRGLDKTISGCDTFDIGDNIADMLRGYGPDEAVEIMGRTVAEWYLEHGDLILSKGLKKEIGSMLKDFVGSHPGLMQEAISDHFGAKYAKRNNGMIRMNVGNVLRGMANRINDSINE